MNILETSWLYLYPFWTQQDVPHHDIAAITVLLSSDGEVCVLLFCVWFFFFFSPTKGNMFFDGLFFSFACLLNTW